MDTPTRILVATEDSELRRAIIEAIRSAGHSFTSATDGGAAWRLISAPRGVPLAIADGGVPQALGLQLCRRLRASDDALACHIIVLTPRSDPTSHVKALADGATDYVGLPLEPAELATRIALGVRSVALRERVAERDAALAATRTQLDELEHAFRRCAWCRQVRHDRDLRPALRAYLAAHPRTNVIDGVCPGCRARMERAARLPGGRAVPAGSPA